MEDLVGRTIDGLLVLEQARFNRRDGRGSRQGAKVRCTTCGREFTCRCDSLLKGTAVCLPCKQNLGSGTVPE